MWVCFLGCFDRCLVSLGEWGTKKSKSENVVVLSLGKRVGCKSRRPLKRKEPQTAPRIISKLSKDRQDGSRGPVGQDGHGGHV